MLERRQRRNVEGYRGRGSAGRLLDGSRSALRGEGTGARQGRQHEGRRLVRDLRSPESVEQTTQGREVL